MGGLAQSNPLLISFKANITPSDLAKQTYFSFIISSYISLSANIKDQRCLTVASLGSYKFISLED
jgi:hypothetical protein